MYLISLYFDAHASGILQSYIDKIAKKTGNTFMTENRVPPHMTLSSIEARNPEVLLPAFHDLADSVTSGRIQVVSVGQLFPYVLYGTPVLNQYLLELSEKAYAAFSQIPETRISRYYRPLSWLPHITLGKTLEKEQMLQAFQVVQNSFQPFTATVTKIGLARVNPHEDLAVKILHSEEKRNIREEL
ncbi:MAG: hypothetical protein Q4B85_03390 [Lachnospiraceae bacterium]|nr:hypothetical protein [Lachnospiraceae bacterium]